MYYVQVYKKYKFIIDTQSCVLFLVLHCTIMSPATYTKTMKYNLADKRLWLLISDEEQD